MGKGGGGQEVVYPSAPAQPTVGESTQDWLANLPDVIAAQGKYGPVEAQQQLDLLKEFGGQYGEQARDINQTLYPETSAIQEKYAGQALEGSEQGISDAQREQLLSDTGGQLGTNIGSPIGAQYQGRQLQLADQNRQDYYRNLGLSLAQRQPLASGSAPATSNYASGFTPQASMNYNSQNYGTYANASRPMTVNQGQSPDYLGGFGSILGGIGSMASGFGW